MVYVHVSHAECFVDKLVVQCGILLLSGLVSRMRVRACVAQPSAIVFVLLSGKASY